MFHLTQLFFCRLTIQVILFFIITININAQSFLDCTSDKILDEKINSQMTDDEQIKKLELDLAKSLSKFDKCVNDYYEINAETVEKKVDELKNNSSKNNSASNSNIDNLDQETLNKQEISDSKRPSKFEKNAKDKNSIDKSNDRFEQKFDVKNKKSVLDNSDEKINNTKDSFKNEKYYTKSDKKFNVKSTPSTSLVGNEKSDIKMINSDEVLGAEVNKATESETSLNSEYFYSETSNSNEEISNSDLYNNIDESSLIPRDIPTDNNDSVLEKQIKIAAIKETDPEKKKRLWNEYRKYKGLPISENNE